jgi:hypothetical protein
MTNITTKPDSLQPAAEMAVDLFDNWFYPNETEVRSQARMSRSVTNLRYHSKCETHSRCRCRVGSVRAW